MKIQLNDLLMDKINGGQTLTHAVSGTELDAEQVEPGLAAVIGVAEINLAPILQEGEDIEGKGEEGILQAVDNN